MKILNLEIKNFLGIETAFIDFSKSSGLTLIEGVNKDSSTASSNGAGKSSIFEGLLWALYGVTKRGLKGDEVINRHMLKKGCLVSAEFISGVVRYKVTRSRGCDGGGAVLKLEADGVDITKGVMKETQVLLEDVIKISQVVFEKAVYFGQEDMKSFASLTDKELKQVFEEALGLLVFSEGELKVKGYVSALNNETLFVTRDIEGIDSKCEIANLKVSSVDKRIEDLEASHEDRLFEIAKEIGRMELEKADLVKIDPPAEIEGLLDVGALDMKLSQLNMLYERLVAKHSAERDGLISKKSEAGSLLKYLNGKMEDLKNSAGMVGNKCKECGRPYSEGEIAEYVRLLKNDIKGRSDVFSKVQAEVKEGDIKEKGLVKFFTPVKEEIERISKAISDFKVRSVLAKQAEETRVARIGRVEADIEGRRSLIIDLVSRKDADHLTLTKEKTKHEADIAVDGRVKDSLLVKLTEIEEKLHIAKMLLEILGNQGAKSYVFDSITPELNRAIALNMSILDPDIEIELSTMKKLKSGELREKFEICVNNRNGAAEYKGNSGGEKGKIDIAISLALNDLMRTMSSDVGVCFFDEPFENLDVEASESVIELLKGIKEENVFVTSHNSAIKDLITNKIKVVKEGGMARIES